MSDNYLIQPKEVKNKLRQPDTNLLIVDIRLENEFNDWNIPGSTNLPVNPFISSGDTNSLKNELQTLPHDKQIIVVCARGINSQVAASVLRNMNYNAVVLANGMKGWNENFDIFEIPVNDNNFKIYQFVRIGKGCLSYIVYSVQTGDAGVFDSSSLIDEYLNFAESNDLHVKYVIDTHTHADHFSGGISLAEALNTDYYVNGIDTDNSFNFKNLSDVEFIQFGNVVIKIIPTPGHTDGSLSFLINDKALICGDVLLLESAGRPDLARNPEETQKGAEKLYDTINSKILNLPDETLILPAHFTFAKQRPVYLSLKDLKDFNNSVNITDKDKFVKYITENMPKTPPNYESIKSFNKSGTVIPIDYAEELEIGPNRCAARN